MRTLPTHCRVTKTGKHKMRFYGRDFGGELCFICNFCRMKFYWPMWRQWNRERLYGKAGT